MKTAKEIKEMIARIKSESEETMLPSEKGGKYRAIWALEWVLKDWED